MIKQTLNPSYLCHHIPHGKHGLSILLDPSLPKVLHIPHIDPPIHALPEGLVPGRKGGKDDDVDDDVPTRKDTTEVVADHEAQDAAYVYKQRREEGREMVTLT